VVDLGGGGSAFGAKAAFAGDDLGHDLWRDELLAERVATSLNAPEDLAQDHLAIVLEDRAVGDGSAKGADERGGLPTAIGAVGGAKGGGGGSAVGTAVRVGRDGFVTIFAGEGAPDEAAEDGPGGFLEGVSRSSGEIRGEPL
jgi:hypothetical protein